MTQEERLLRQSSSTPWRRVGDEILLAPPGRDDFDVLSGTGAVVWELLEEPCAMTDIEAELAHLYGVTEGEIAADVEQLLVNLIQSGAIEEIQGANDSGR